MHEKQEGEKKKERKKRKWKVPSQHHLPWVCAPHPHRRMLAGEVGPKVRLVCAACPYLSLALLANIFTRLSARICSPRSILQLASSPPCPQIPCFPRQVHVQKHGARSTSSFPVPSRVRTSCSSHVAGLCSSIQTFNFALPAPN